MTISIPDKDLRTNVELLDDQHEMLFSLIARLRAGLEMDELDEDEILTIIAELTAYASYHFHSEEKYLEEHGYNHLDLHRDKHREFAEQIEGFTLESMLGTPGLGKEMLDYLEKWLITHIKYMDVSACRQVEGRQAKNRNGGNGVGNE